MEMDLNEEDWNKLLDLDGYYLKLKSLCMIGKISKHEMTEK